MYIPFYTRPYLRTDTNSYFDELLISAKSDKLIISTAEFRELFVERVKRFFDKEAEVRVIFEDLLVFLRERINNNIPLRVDWFGNIEKQYVKRDNRYDVVTKKYVTSEYYLIKFVVDPKFAAFFSDKENRKILMEKIMRRSKAFVKEFGKVKIIGNR